MANSVTPVEKARAKLLTQMTPATREVAQEFLTSTVRTATGVVMFHYNLGQRIAQVVNDEATFGDSAVELLAGYLGIKGGPTYLYALRNFAETFDKEYVKQNTSNLMANGDTLSVAHWLNLTKLSEEAARTNMLKRVFAESMSSKDLDAEIKAGMAGNRKNTRQGGRNPKVPSNPLIGLHSICQMGVKIVRFEPVANSSVFDALDALSPDHVTADVLKRTQSALEQLDETLEKMHHMQKRLQGNVKRLQSIRNGPRAIADKTEDKAETGAKPAAPKQAMAKMKKKKK